MPPTPRRPASTVPYRPATPAVEPPAPAPAPANDDKPPANTIEADQIYADGITAADALAVVLGDRVTGVHQTDCKAAMAVIDEWLTNIPLWRSVILHLMFNDYARRPEHPVADRWLWVAHQLRKPKTTVHKYAHEVECYALLPGVPTE
jgi:hypothetical protein